AGTSMPRFARYDTRLRRAIRCDRHTPRRRAGEASRYDGTGMDVAVRTRRGVTETVGSAAESSPTIPRFGIEFCRGDAIGDYVIEHELGRGGMGAVYAAWHPVIERRVAIKVLRRELSND